MPFELPRSPIEWERSLCRRFLEAIDGDLTPIRSFEVTKATLAESCGGDPIDDAESALEAFHESFDSDRTVAALEHGVYRSMAHEGLPGCFGYLALTLLIDSLMDEEVVELGDFRAKLRQFLSSDRSFSNLSGVATMWRELKRWLDDRVSRGEPFRPLELPSIPPSWTHIGYTLRLSFPSRRDRRLMSQFLDDHANVIERPRLLLDGFRQTAESDKASWGMKTAFEEFRADFLSGRRALASHRFWTFVRAMAAGKNRSGRPTEISIQIVRDQDDEWMFQVDEVDKSSSTRAATLGDAADASMRAGRHQLSASISKGYLLFRQIGNATWRAAAELSECRGHIFVGLSEGAAERVAERLGDLIPSGDWCLTAEPIGVSSVETVLQTIFGSADDSDAIVSVNVYGGIRTGSSWLGRPRFLPFVSADDDNLIIHGNEGAHGRLNCAEESMARGIHKLEADASVEGRFVISPAAVPGAPTPWTKQISFVSDAFVHDGRRRPPRGIDLVEWNRSKQPLAPPGSIKSGWDDCASEVEDLIEAVYAGGRSGWEEVDIVPQIRRWSEAPLNPWDVLRWLQDSTVVIPVLRPQWRGRTWLLTPPTLTTWTEPEETVILDGCIPARLVGDFLRTVEGAGGAAFRLCRSRQFGLPIYGCHGVGVELLASRLGWKVRKPYAASQDRLAFDLTARSTQGYSPAGLWNWRRSRFEAESPENSEAVELKRWVHVGRRDHDLYVVSRGDDRFTFLSRAAAIVCAHSLAARPLFRFDGETLLRLGKEGALPDALAADLRYSCASNPELNTQDGSYRYAADRASAEKIATTLPNIVERQGDFPGRSAAQVVSLAVHSGGRVRPAWKAGRVTTDHSP